MTTSPKIARYTNIPGWFHWEDRLMFDTVLDASDHAPGVLVELGAYLGRSAVIIGNHLRAGERFIVVDLFGSEPFQAHSAADAANRRENTFSYKSVTRQEFESNYLALHTSLPVVVHGLSSEIVEHVEPGTARFIHVDASHLYPHVADDARNAKLLLRKDGVVVFDDYRTQHTPGVAAAVWAAAATDGLIPFALTARKFYGTFGEPTEHLAAIRKLAEGDERLTVREQDIFGHTVIRLTSHGPQQKAAASAPGAPVEEPAPASTAKVHASAGQRLAQIVARDYAPPALTRAIRKRRAKR